MSFSAASFVANYRKRRGRITILNNSFRWASLETDDSKNAVPAIDLPIETIVYLQKKMHNDNSALLYFELTNSDKQFVFRFTEGV